MAVSLLTCVFCATILVINAAPLQNGNKVVAVRKVMKNDARIGHAQHDVVGQDVHASSEEKTLIRVPKVRENQKMVAQQLEKTLVTTDHLTSIGGVKERHRESEVKETNNGKIVGDVKQTMDSTGGGKTNVHTDINVPSLGEQKPVDQTLPVDIQVDEDELTIDFSPKAVAEYLLATDDFIGFDAALEDLVNSTMMTRKEAKQYKEQVIKEFGKLMGALERSREKEIVNQQQKVVPNVNMAPPPLTLQSIKAAEPKRTHGLPTQLPEYLNMNELRKPTGAPHDEDEDAEIQLEQMKSPNGGSFGEFNANKDAQDRPMITDNVDDASLTQMIDVIRNDLLKTLRQSDDMRDMNLTDKELQEFIETISVALAEEVMVEEKDNTSNNNKYLNELDEEEMELQQVKGDKVLESAEEKNNINNIKKQNN